MAAQLARNLCETLIPMLAELRSVLSQILQNHRSSAT